MTETIIESVIAFALLAIAWHVNRIATALERNTNPGAPVKDEIHD